ncbi:glycoside hydrolase family 2 protein [Oceaniglobus ichthyenteri]|uniref:glycoside hydrolase family 2 protein n=1 Tax=Oceaniglobus ichthyenteri TaxID=2136177 RepID=UPI000D3C032A|nr:glycoside hydrolase family 2 TIM barrel-domain containing protein [Oceaniglobus ichthyenteri]
MPHSALFCENWSFLPGFDPAWTTARQTGTPVALPHNAVDLPFDYFDEKCYQQAFTYQTTLEWQKRFAGREIWLRFDGAMANAQVYLNGTHLGGHPDGYTPFRIRLTDHLSDGENLITVMVDGSENPDIPPFGGQIDYLTYAGIYREVWLEQADPVSIDNVKIETPDPLAAEKTVHLRCLLANPQGGAVSGTCKVVLHDGAGTQIATAETELDDQGAALEFDGLAGLTLWSLDTPTLYRATITITGEGFTDTRTESFGFRAAEFTPDGFFLNGERVKLIGLNRHQSFPYVGYAMGREAQERDAEIVKHDLGCNIVRTSHYPQSKWFIEHCDRIGLLVLEEIPGWQHIGGEAWKDEAVKNVRRMIERDWNHPSIIMWGVRINESVDDDAFYARTNALAHELDTTRQTGGIRKHMHSTLLEDVYTFNDFVLGDFERPLANIARRGLRQREEVTGLSHPVPYLITEYNGHMFPTKIIDNELRQMEHVTRHLEVLDYAHGDPGISGCIGWCMFDYNTHADFGSGDRVCHHGVLSMFREPKFAAHAYSSQRDPSEKVVMEPVTHWARGERNIGGVFPLMILTNCDLVRMILPDGQSVDIRPDSEGFPHLPHPPAILRLGDVDENIIGKWGMSWPDVTFEGFVGDTRVATRKFSGAPVLTRLAVTPDRESFGADRQEMRVALRALDQLGNVTPFVDLPVTIAVAGAASLLGPDQITLRGGSAGFWLRSTGTPGDVRVTVSSPRFDPVVINLTTTAPEKEEMQ